MVQSFPRLSASSQQKHKESGQERQRVGSQMARAVVLVTDLQAGFVLLIGVLLIQGEPELASGLKVHTAHWMAVKLHRPARVNFHLDVRSGCVRGKNVLVWLVPFALAPLPTLMLFILFLQPRQVTLAHLTPSPREVF
jgi:hypothetical protein